MLTRLGSATGEQRSHTLLVFLNDIPEEDGGGHLHFPELGLHILPRAGDAVLWPNLTDAGEPDPHGPRTRTARAARTGPGLSTFVQFAL